ncbi:Bax inhibitor-1/YccA family protein [Fonticella tunisiensis]|uniref:Modulator of FtsH protease n=1 Tax=Fonticella tunisiensis TaxID=1096341 RepID=A0A4R7KQU6_9CLOT|nr:Bax inhibitor-1/YccA family protein [Fonticella tunisiensis]TDT60963.1 hypothetical protein EDD71_11081 [Fonticella tunisiensis]
MERVYERSRTDFISKVMTHMGVGLLITFLTAYLTASNYYLAIGIAGSPLMFVLALMEIGLVIYLTNRIDKMSLSGARLGFYVYAVLNGLTLSVIFLAYDLPNIYSAFITAAVMFLGAGFIGISIKKDLSAFGHFLMLMLIGIIAASVINIFVGSAGLDYMISLVGVLLFSALTAYDMQKIKSVHYNVYYFDGEAAGKYSIIGALQLYLDFINLFLYLLKLFAKKD